ncbi:phage holin family protein [Caloramator proteoclasticus]|uniref:Putative membrane protein n=1 Tax=Caloramator proteoclasticus DSM 10124 TaxID=1121262 RepID=A0A1M4WA51_9CLOT|nr:phage holin family protein [Caloramator proteoclasticus]SHE78045.1 putative membrane protein [Caloramator proteoclasticus DSM 10124]
MKKGILTKIILNAASIYITASIVKGVEIRGFLAAIVAAAILGIVNALIRPIFLLFSLPINLMTLGLFTFVINGLMLSIAASVTQGFYISNFGSAIVASIIISIVSAILNFLLVE